jgi:hypothetical protein
MVAAARRDFVEHCNLPEDEFLSDSFEPAHQSTAQSLPVG